MGTEKSNTPVLQHSPIPTQAFTLIEILLVVVIILIAAGVSVPMFRGAFQSTQMQDTVRSTVRMARYARSLSILKQEECVLRLQNGLLSLSCGGTNSSEPEISRRLPKDITVGEFENLAETDRLSGEERAVRFYSNGMNDGFSVTFRDEKDRTTTVRCSPLTGKTTVEE